MGEQTIRLALLALLAAQAFRFGALCFKSKPKLSKNVLYNFSLDLKGKKKKLKPTKPREQQSNPRKISQDFHRQMAVGLPILSVELAEQLQVLFSMFGPSLRVKSGNILRGQTLQLLVQTPYLQLSSYILLNIETTLSQFKITVAASYQIPKPELINFIKNLQSHSLLQAVNSAVDTVNEANRLKQSETIPILPPLVPRVSQSTVTLSKSQEQGQNKEQLLRNIQQHFYFQKQMHQEVKEQEELAWHLPSGRTRYKDQFQELRSIGQGGFGHVFLAKGRLDRQTYAIKKVPLNYLNLQQAKKTVKEVQNLSRMHHVNIVRYYQSWIEELSNWQHLYEQLKIQSQQARRDFLQLSGSYSQSSSNRQPKNSQFTYKMLYIVMEYCNQNLGDSLKINKENNILHLIKQVLEALVYIHSSKLIHRDLKPANIFLKQGDVKVGDFGLAIESGQRDSVTLRSQRSSGVGTPLYRAPQIKSKRYDNKVDIYSLGVIIIDFHYQFKTYHEKDLILREISRSRSMSAEVARRFGNEQLKQLVVKMMSPNPEDRPSADETLKLISGQRFVQLLSDINSTDHYAYRTLIKHLFDIKSSFRPAQTQLRLIEKPNPLIQSLGLRISPARIDMSLRNLQSIFYSHCATRYIFSDLAPQRMKRRLGNWSDEVQLSLYRKDKKLFITSQGSMAQIVSDASTLWLNLVEDYFRVQQGETFLKGFSHIRCWKKQGFQYKSSLAFLYCNQHNYFYGNSDEFLLLHEMAVVISQILGPKQTLLFNHIQLLSHLAATVQLSLQSFLEIVTNPEIRTALEQKDNERCLAQLRHQFKLQNSIGFRIINVLSNAHSVLRNTRCYDLFLYLQQAFDALGLTLRFDVLTVTQQDSSGLIISHQALSLNEWSRAHKMLLLEVNHNNYAKISAPSNKICSFMFPNSIADVVVQTRGSQNEIIDFCARLWRRGVRTEWCRGVPLKIPKNLFYVQLRKESKKKKIKIWDCGQELQLQEDQVIQYICTRKSKKLN